MLRPEELPLEDILERLQISLVPIQASIDSVSPGGKARETYPAWVATSYTPRTERAEGKAPREAVLSLLTKLDIL